MHNPSHYYAARVLVAATSRSLGVKSYEDMLHFRAALNVYCYKFLGAEPRGPTIDN